MRPDAEAATGPVWAAKAGDPRVTPIGRLLRRTRLDELPQLWNVLIGEMSLVGPRPERPEFVARADASRFRSTASATSSGRASPAGRRCATPTARASRTRCEKLQYDLFYIKNLSISLDLFIISRDGQDRHSAAGRVGHERARRPTDRPVVNAMTVDVEDYFQVSAFDGVVPRAEWDRLESRVVREHRAAARRSSTSTACAATFFVLGWVAERHPALVARDRRRGPRDRVARLRAPARLRPDARRVPRRRAPREAAARGRRRAQPVVGYRAPSYSITTRVALGARRADRGRLRYDASIFPIRHDRYGIPDAPRHPYVLTRDGGHARRSAAVDRARRAR